MPHKLTEQYDFDLVQLQASGSTNGSTAALNCTGYARAVYVISGSASAASSELTIQAQECATAGGTYTVVSATSGSVALPTITASNDNEVYLLEVPVASAKPFQKLYLEYANDGFVLSIVGAREGGGVVTLPVTQENTVGKW